jgi:hypothetical protein
MPDERPIPFTRAAAMNEPRPDRLNELLAAYGADPARWPAPDRARFAPRLDASPELAAALHEAQSLDALFEPLAPAPDAPSGLRRTILLTVAQEPRAPRGLAQTLRELWRELGGIRVAAPALAAACAFGIGLAWMTAPLPDAPDDASEDVLALAQFEQSYEESAP